jgi:hypothetical protein
MGRRRLLPSHAVCNAESAPVTLTASDSFTIFCRAQQQRVNGVLSHAQQRANARRRAQAAAAIELWECEQTTLR